MGHVVNREGRPCVVVNNGQHRRSPRPNLGAAGRIGQSNVYGLITFKRAVVCDRNREGPIGRIAIGPVKVARGRGIIGARGRCSVRSSIMHGHRTHAAVGALNPDDGTRTALVHHVARNAELDQAMLAFAEGTSVVDVLNLARCERAIEDLDFIDQPVKEIARGTTPRANLKWIGAVAGRNTCGGSAIQGAIEINLKVRSVKDSGHVVESPSCNLRDSRDSCNRGNRRVRHAEHELTTGI